MEIHHQDRGRVQLSCKQLLVFLLFHLQHVSTLQCNITTPVNVFRLVVGPFLGTFPFLSTTTGCYAEDFVTVCTPSITLFDGELGPEQPDLRNREDVSKYVAWGSTLHPYVSFDVDPPASSIDLYIVNYPALDIGLPNLHLYSVTSSSILDPNQIGATEVTFDILNNDLLSHEDISAVRRKITLRPREPITSDILIRWTYTDLFGVEWFLLSEVEICRDPLPAFLPGQVEFLAPTEMTKALLPSAEAFSSGRLMLTCTVSSEGSFIWRWRKGPRLITSGGKISIHSADGTRTSILIINFLGFVDADIYSCEASFSSLVEYTSRAFDVQFRMILEATPTSAEFFEGESATLTCEVFGYILRSGDVYIEWTSNNTEANLNSHRIRTSSGSRVLIYFNGIISESIVSTLTILQLSLEDEGDYTCSVRGRQATIQLYIISDNITATLILDEHSVRNTDDDDALYVMCHVTWRLMPADRNGRITAYSVTVSSSDDVVASSGLLDPSRTDFSEEVRLEPTRRYHATVTAYFGTRNITTMTNLVVAPKGVPPVNIIATLILDEDSVRNTDDGAVYVMCHITWRLIPADYNGRVTAYSVTISSSDDVVASSGLLDPPRTNFSEEVRLEPTRRYHATVTAYFGTRNMRTMTNSVVAPKGVVKCPSQTDPQTTVQCRVDRFCDQTPGVESTLEDCCNHNTDPPGLTFTTPGMEGCQLCPIVFGFNQTTFVGVEREESYTVEVGFLSGSPADVIVSYNIEKSFNSASINDLRLLTINGRFLPLHDATQLHINSVAFKLMVDGVTQEENETFSFILTSDVGRLRCNPMMISTLEGIIVDGDDGQSQGRASTYVVEATIVTVTLFVLLLIVVTIFVLAMAKVRHRLHRIAVKRAGSSSSGCSCQDQQDFEPETFGFKESTKV